MHHTSVMIVRPTFAITAVFFQVVTGTVVFGPADISAGVILHFVQATTFVTVEMTVSKSPTISAVDMPLLSFQPSGLRECDLTTADSLVDAPGLSIVSGSKTIGRPGCRSPDQCQCCGQKNNGYCFSFHIGLLSLFGSLCLSIRPAGLS
jgi:hypothetical protein